MLRRTTISLLAALMALCIVPQGQSGAQSIFEKYAVIWQADVENRKTIEREAVARRRFSSLRQLHFPESLAVAFYSLTHSFDGRAPPQIPIAG
jgi:hypothetical protein